MMLEIYKNLAWLDGITTLTTPTHPLINESPTA